MPRFRLAATCSLVLFLATGWLMGQDNKSGSDDTTPSPKAKGSLPTYFKQLGLTDEQRQKVIKIHGSYRAKIDSLKEQITQLTNEERAELSKVLSDTQRVRLRELRSHESEPVKEAPVKEDKKSDKKTESK